MRQSLKIWNVFIILTLKPIFSKANTFFKKLDYRILVESARIESASFPYKATLSEANVKTNSMGSTRWAYHKEWSFASNCIIFPKILFQFKDVIKRNGLMYQPSKCPYSYFSKALEFFFEGVFSQ